ncbi:hypothetical protein ACFV2G_34435, partial [Streptomyces sp. NPDC059701]
PITRILRWARTPSPLCCAGAAGPRPPPRARPAAPTPAAGGGTAPSGGVVFRFDGGTPSIGGSLVGGDQHGVSGGHVAGDVHLGRSGGGPA